ncbi:MAG: sodium/solute symporter [Pirellulales bacterium]|nr:sodium/solute symporter [Pirellulales bacterium]
MIRYSSVIGLACLWWLVSVERAGADSYQFDELAPLPDHGVAGAFIGVLGDQLIVAGGSWFPEGSAGAKAYDDRILAFDLKASKWRVVGRLPARRAHGASAVLGGALICVGGENKNGAVDTVWRVALSAEREPLIEVLSNLPFPTSYQSATVSQGSVYVAGGKLDSGIESGGFYRLPADGKQWESLPPWPGAPRFGASLVTQHDGEFLSVYLIGGKSNGKYLRDGFRFDVREEIWRPIANLPRPAMLAPTVAVGQSQILLCGGSDGKDAARWRELGAAFRFPREIFTYSTITNRWVKRGQLREGIASTNAVTHGDQVFLPTGEIRPTVRSSQLVRLTPQPISTVLGAIDYGVLLAYLGFLIAIGAYVGRRQATTDDFFLGGRRIPWWAIGLSLLATQVSSIGFMAIPAKTFATDWRYFAGIATWFVVVPLVVRFFIPVFRGLRLTTAYDYLERRFDLRIRCLASAAYSLMQLGRMAIVLYLPAAAIATVTGIDARLAILIMGVIATAYTIVGGLNAVVWTDVAQAFVLCGGALFCIAAVFFQLDGGWHSGLDAMRTDHKLRMLDLGWSSSEAVLWVVLVGNVMIRLAGLTSDQAIVQRYLSARSEKQAGRALWLDVAVSIPWAVIVFGLGTALFLYYQAHPGAFPATASTIEVVPLFVVQQMPLGLRGLVIAAILAAAMSSLDSSVHSVATTWTNDWLARFRPDVNDLRQLRFAKGLIAVLGVFAVGTALWIASADIRSLWDYFFQIAGLFGGGLAGLFVLARFVPHASTNGALAGVITSFLVLVGCWMNRWIHPLLFTGVGMATVVLVGAIWPSGTRRIAAQT